MFNNKKISTFLFVAFALVMMPSANSFAQTENELKTKMETIQSELRSINADISSKKAAVQSKYANNITVAKSRVAKFECAAGRSSADCIQEKSKLQSELSAYTAKQAEEIAQIDKEGKERVKAKEKELKDAQKAYEKSAKSAGKDVKSAQKDADKAQDKLADAEKDYEKCLNKKGESGCSKEKAKLDAAEKNVTNTKDALSDAKNSYSTATTSGQDIQKAKAAEAAAKAAAAKAEAEKKASQNSRKDYWSNDGADIRDGKEPASMTAAKDAKKAQDKSKEDLAKAEAALKNCSGADACREAAQEVKSAKADYEKNSETLKSAVAEANKSLGYTKELYEGSKNGLNMAKSELDAIEKNCVANPSTCDHTGLAKAKEDVAAAEKEMDTYAKGMAAFDQKVPDSTGKIYGEAGSSATGGSGSGLSSGEGDTPSDFGKVEYTAKAASPELGGQTNGDVFSTITRRALQILFGLKQIVYTIAAFGLVGFAWAAIFGKLQWKWFANLAMGLFLVANMGRFIEYFISPQGDNHMDVVVQPLSYGDYLSKGLGDTNYVYEEKPATDINNSIGVGQDGGDITQGDRDQRAQAEEKAKEEARKFCGKAEGASGWKNFTSCMKDVASSAKNAVNAVVKAKDTVDNTKAKVESIGQAVKNIGTAIDDAKGGSIMDIFNAADKVMDNAGYIGAMPGSIVNGVVSGASSVSNSVQNVGKSTDKVNELNNTRGDGTATNKVDQYLKGQQFGEDGKVIRNEDGTIARDKNYATGVQDTTNTVGKQSEELSGIASGVATDLNQGSKVVDSVLGGPQRRQENYQKEQRAKQDAVNKKAEQDRANAAAAAAANARAPQSAPVLVAPAVIAPAVMSAPISQVAPTKQVAPAGQIAPAVVASPTLQVVPARQDAPLAKIAPVSDYEAQAKPMARPVVAKDVVRDVAVQVNQPVANKVALPNVVAPKTGVVVAQEIKHQEAVVRSMELKSVQARDVAVAKENLAKRTQAEANVLAQKAASTNDAVVQRAAQAASRRAELARLDAQKAQVASSKISKELNTAKQNLDNTVANSFDGSAGVGVSPEVGSIGVAPAAGVSNRNVSNSAATRADEFYKIQNKSRARHQRLIKDVDRVSRETFAERDSVLSKQAKSADATFNQNEARAQMYFFEQQKAQRSQSEAAQKEERAILENQALIDEENALIEQERMEAEQMLQAN